MKKLICGLALFAFACGGSNANVVNNTAQAAAPATMVVQNSSSQTICYVQLSPSSDSNWGNDQLASDEVIAPGGVREWEITSGMWDVRLLDCDQTPLYQQQGIAVEPNGQAALNFAGN